LREFRPLITQKKLRPSKFFEGFIQSKGPNGVARASSGEIQRALKSFYLDLAYGNIVQDKYMPILISDPRIMQEALVDAENKLLYSTIELQCLEFSRNSGLPITAQPAFEGIYNEHMMRAQTYGVILEGLRGFHMSVLSGVPNPEYLISISTKLNSITMRGAKQQLML
jgi:hypothetical protein